MFPISTVYTWRKCPPKGPLLLRHPSFFSLFSARAQVGRICSKKHKKIEKRKRERERASETRFEKFALCTKRSEFPCWVDAQRSGSTFLSLSSTLEGSPPPSPPPVEVFLERAESQGTDSRRKVYRRPAGPGLAVMLLVVMEEIQASMYLVCCRYNTRSRRRHTRACVSGDGRVVVGGVNSCV